MANTVIPVFFSVDDNYIPYLAVALQSIKENASKRYRYEINILTDSVSDKNRDAILSMREDNINIEFVNIERKFAPIADKLSIRDYYSMATYFRFFIPYMFSQYDRGVYLDCDTVLEADVARLYFKGKKNSLLSAVPDEVVTEIEPFGKYTKSVLGIPPEEYFNAGVLVMNLKKMRREKFLEAFLKMLEEVKFPAAQDQDYLNVLCRGDVCFLGKEWNKTPFPETRIDCPKLIHFKLNFRPWRYDGVCYGEVFWKYAEKTVFYGDILRNKESFSEEDAAKDNRHARHLMELALSETARSEKDGYEPPVGYALKNAPVKALDPHSERLSILKKIEEYEKKGFFDIDVENDPPARKLLKNECDYTLKKLSSRIKTRFANACARRYFDGLIKKREIIIKEIRGISNFTDHINEGLIITSNHFHPYEQYALYKAIQPYLGKKDLYKVIREGNYTGMRGLYGFFFRNCNTLPIGSRPGVWKEFSDALSTLLKRKEKILIYPEQAMWWNYKKPRPLKPGAFRFAVKEKAPVLPVFITMEDSDKTGADGFKVQAYTIHFNDLIYPSGIGTVKEQAREMALANYEVWKGIYEREYGIPLTYTTEKEVPPCYM